MDNYPTKFVLRREMEQVNDMEGQEVVNEFEAVRIYLENGGYPNGFGKEDKRRLRQQSAPYSLRDGLLYHTARGKV